MNQGDEHNRDHTIIDLLRHGEPQGGRMYRGWVDHPLSDHGWQQMRSATAASRPWQVIVSSPMQRCRAFAEELGAQLAIDVRVDERLKEVGFGHWEGKTAEQIRAADPSALANFYRDPVNARPCDAESLADFQARVSAALEAVLQEHPGRHLLLVTHAGVIRAAIAHTLQAPLQAIYRTHVDNAAITRFKQTGERPLSLIFHGKASL